MDLAKQTCIPCQGGSPPLKGGELLELLDLIDPSWSIVDEHHLTNTWTFPDFASALAFVNAIGAIAEEQGHHPDLHLSWGKVGVELWTHKIDGLVLADFILASKVDQLSTSDA
ncbi:MAG: 4a-hydroxytetrahydrobiopterin dehydratase [Kiritimatiellia bacterium]|jgi:4a-hydroxytetrahydrobiopterin dehydratase